MAEQIRVGLEEQAEQRVEAETVDVLDEIWHGKTVRRHVVEFAALLSTIALIIAGVRAYKGDSLINTGAFTIASLALMYISYYAPKVLYPVWDAWMTLAEKLGVVMTAVILTIGWVLLIIPCSFMLRLLRIRVMDVSFRLPVTTYWEDREDRLHDFKLLERQF